MAKTLVQLMPYPLDQVGGIESHVRGITNELYSVLNQDKGTRVSLVYRNQCNIWSHIDAINLAHQTGNHVTRNRGIRHFHGRHANDEALRVIKNADVVHVHGLDRIAYLRVLRDFNLHSKIVLSTHGSFWSELRHVSGLVSFSRNAFDRFFGQNLLNRFGTIIVASEAEYELTLQLLPTKFNRKFLHILPLPIYFPAAEGKLDIEASSSGRLIALGRQDKIKNFELLARTIIANPELPSCDIVGPEGNSAEALRRIIASAPIDRVRVLAPIYDEKEKSQVLRHAIAVVVTSTFESFSLVAHEAIALDTPLVISNGAAHSINETAAEIFVSGNADSLRNALLRAIEDGRSRESQEARERVRQTYDTYSTYCQKLLLIYENAPSVNEK